MLNSKTIDQQVKDWWNGSPKPSAYVKPAAAGHAAKQGDVYLDGHKVGKVIGGRMSKAANRPLGSSVSTDPRRGFPQVATP
jgi:hypothetical protein